MNAIGAPELILIIVIVVLLFGVGRIGKIGGELGKGISAFRDGLKGDPDETVKKVDEKPSENTSDSEKKEDTLPPVE
jgi:sec-independent protein translocase protein TatA